jgi:hypothetical protein
MGCSGGSLIHSSLTLAWLSETRHGGFSNCLSSTFGVNTPDLVVSTYHSTVPVLVHLSFLSSSKGMIDNGPV